MKQQLIGAATIALTFVSAQPVRAELLHVEIKTLGMD